MARRLIIAARAQREIGEAYTWYEEQLPGLGARFLEALDTQFEAIASSPALFAETQRGIRRAFLSRFPYGVFYASRSDLISVLAVIHAARHPRRWPRS